jgi:Flp pilus assembly protein TadD
MSDSAAIIEFPGAFSKQELEQSVADGDAGLQMGRPDLALKIFDLTLRLVPDHPALLFRRAVALAALGRAEDAIEAYGQTLALKIESDEFEIHLRANRSELLVKFGRFAEALEDSARIASLRPDAPDAMLGHARVLAFCGRCDDAIDVYDDIIARQKSLTFEGVGVDLIIAERGAMVSLFLESGVA